MFKELRNEAIYTFQLETLAPFVIKSGNEDVLDASLPDSQVLRSYRNGFSVPVIPGSTLKGVFRSRAEQLLKSMGYPISDLFSENHDHDDLVHRLFGSTKCRGRVVFHDAFPVSGTEIVTGLRHGVGINRFTGGAENSRKFDTEVVEQGCFQVEVKLVNYEIWHLALIAWLIQDLSEGYIKIGSATTRGFGRFTVTELVLTVREYRRLSDRYLHGYEPADVLQRELDWTSSFFKKEARLNSMEELIGVDGMLVNARFPEVKAR